MANRRKDKSCTDIRFCADDIIDGEIRKFQYSHIAKTGVKGYTKPEATADLFRELIKKVNG